MEKETLRKKKSLTHIIVALLASILIAGFLSNPTLAATEDVENVSSTATINKQVAIGVSAELAAGIAFGSLDPDTANNADSDNGANNGITADSANNINIDLCIRVNANISKDASNNIPSMNYTWFDNSSTTVTNNETSINASYQKGFNTDIAASATSYWGLWLDVPATQTAGSYNNTVQFKAVETGTAC